MLRVGGPECAMEVVRRRLRERRYAVRTEEAYVYWIRRYIVENGRRHPADLDEGDVARFLSMLALKEQVAALERREIIVRAGKGNKDRRTPLAEPRLG